MKCGKRSVKNFQNTFITRSFASARLSRIVTTGPGSSTRSASEVHRYFREGKIQEIADYCETDIVNTYRVWLRYELFRGRLTPNEFEASEQGLAAYLKAKEEAKPHLMGMAG